MATAEEALILLLKDSKPQTTTLGTPSEILLAWLGQRMAQTKAAYPNQTITEETATMHLDFWYEMVSESGQARFDQALRNHCKSSRFLPQPADLTKQLKKLARAEEQRKLAHSQANQFRRCVDCSCTCDSSSGFVVIRNPVTRHSYAIESECHKVWKLEARCGV